MKNNYHIGKDGIPRQCKANKKNCPLQHFNSMEKAQEYLDELNIQELTKYPSTTKTKLKKYGNIIDVYELNFERQLEKLDNKIKQLEQQAKKRCKKKDKKSKEKYLQSFKQADATYQMLSIERNNKLDALNKFIEERKQVANFVDCTKDNIDDLSFSRASSSSYIVYNDNSLEQVIAELDKQNIYYKIRPNIKSSLDTNFLVRFSNHYPKEFYKAQLKDDKIQEDDIWNYTDASILVDFSKNYDKINKKEINNKIKWFTSKQVDQINELQKELNNVGI